MWKSNLNIKCKLFKFYKHYGFESDVSACYHESTT